MTEGTKKPFPPLILGILTARMLRERRYPESLWECDGVELRADGLSSADVIPAVEDFAAEKKQRGFTGPVVFTLRLQRDGGAWEDARAAEREPLWNALAKRSEALCDIVDVEVEEVASLAEETRFNLFQGKLKVLLSHHSPSSEDLSTWESVLATMQAYHPAAVKFAVMVRDRETAAALLRFARKVAKDFPLSCVIGMGVSGRETRIVSPLLGCPITYAFLNKEGPLAPGQFPAKVLQTCFTLTKDRPLLEASEENWIDWVRISLREIPPNG